jgi:Allophanate hydrolase subunit 2
VAEVVGPGQRTSRVGPRDWSRAEVGVPPGGPFDDEMMARANRSVGNPPFAPALGCVLVGPRLRFLRASTIAWCAGSQTLRRNVSAGEELDLGRIEGSFRGYLAIKGGFRDPRPLFGESPVVLRAGDRLGATDVADFGPFEESGSESSSEDRLTIRILTGPHDAPPLPEEWIVSSQLNRVGIRLTPAAPSAVSLPADLPSCGMQFGTLQWHPDGSLLAMGPDHPVTGGYLQPATVLRGDLWKLGQLAPGDRVRLVAG